MRPKSKTSRTRLGLKAVAPALAGAGLVLPLVPAIAASVSVGVGKFQVLGKYGTATYEAATGDIDQKTGEFNLNYIISSFNARVSLFYIDKSFDPNVGGDNKTYGIGLQIQM